MDDDGKYKASSTQNQMSAKERANKNNADNIKNAADIAMATKNPYAMAAGAAVKVADKVTGGKASEALGKAVTQAAKRVPGAQKALNKVNESGAGDKAAKVASLKNGTKGGGAKNAASKGAENAVGQKGMSELNKTVTKNAKKATPKDDQDQVVTQNDDSQDEKKGKIAKKIKRKLLLKVLIILSPFIIYLLILVLIVLIIFVDDTSSEVPFLDEYYDFNLTEVYITNDYADENNRIIYDKASLEEYVKGILYARLNGNIPDISDSQKLEYYKTYMIILKAKALSYGDYTAQDKEMFIASTSNGIPFCDFRNGCDIYENGNIKTYISSIYEGKTDGGTYSYDYESLSQSEIQLLDEAYEDTKYLLLTPSNLNESLEEYSYDEPELNAAIDTQILDKAQNGEDYTNIIDSISSYDSYKIYNLEDYAMVYLTSENSEFWWPIGSSSPSSGNIYGGEPSTVYISSYFVSSRTINGVTKPHYGIDIAAGSVSNNCGTTNIIASRSGTVTAASDGCPTAGYYGGTCGGGYGNYVIIDHGDGTQTVYAHMKNSSIEVSVGSSVQQGQKIGEMGSSGSSTGCHLHFEVRVDGSKVNPLDYVDPDNPRPVAISSTTVEGNSNTQTVCLTLKASGYSNNAVAGLMANIVNESGFNPTSLGDSGTSYGLCQWHNGRWTNLKNYCGNKSSDIGCQLSFLTHELQSSYYGVYSYLGSSHGAWDMAYYFCLNFEIPANKYSTCSTRASGYAASYLSYVNNGCN